jgi:hypothetical protein
MIGFGSGAARVSTGAVRQVHVTQAGLHQQNTLIYCPHVILYPIFGADPTHTLAGCI